jgi:DNA repair and recombination protein RAD52
MPAPVRPHTGLQGMEANGAKPGPHPHPLQTNPQTPKTGYSRSNSGSTGVMRPPQDGSTVFRGQQGPGRPLNLNQPSRAAAAAASAPASPIQQQNNLTSIDDNVGFGIPQNLGPVGFFSARAVTALPESTNNDGPPPALPKNLAAFNPKAESPSIRKTPGIDHNSTRPTTRDFKHIPGTVEPSAGGATLMPTNIINPQLDVSRRIGAPGSFSPLANKGAYKPPTMKRPVDVATGGPRPPLGNLPANSPIPAAADGGNDWKRQRLNGP